MEYTSILKSNWALHKDKGSKFWGKSFHVTNQTDIKNCLDNAKEMYPDATHWCYAAIYDYPKEEHMSQDNGEPNGTAGLPIIRKIQSSGLLNCLVIVVRYYGGTKLGTRGLIEAYGTCAELSLTESLKKLYVLTKDFILEADFVNENSLHVICKKENAELISTDYSATSVKMHIRIPQSREAEFKEVCKEFYLVSIKPV